MQNIQFTNKSPFFVKSTDESVFMTDLGVAAVENIKKSYTLKCLSGVSPHKFYTIQEVSSFLDYYKATTRTYKNLPLLLETQNQNSLLWHIFYDLNSVDFLINVLHKTISWYESIGCKVSKVVLNEQFKSLLEEDLKHITQEQSTLPPQVAVQCTLVIGEVSLEVNVLEEVTTQEKIDFMTKEGIRIRPGVYKLEVFKDLAYLLSLLAIHYSNTLPSEISPIKAVVLSVSEKWEQLASLVALKINASVDNSSDAVGKKIRYWKSLGCPAIYVVGEKDMKELCETGKITLMKNSINSVMEPEVIAFI